MGDKELKKPGRLKRFCRRICMPLHRALSSYLETTPAVSVRDEMGWTHEKNVADQHDGTIKYDQPMSLNYVESSKTRRSRSRYRTTRPVHPSSRSSPRQAPILDYTQGFAASLRSSMEIDEDIREETQSPEYDAPRVNGQKRRRFKHEGNADLPGPLRAEPAKASLADLKRRNSNTSLVEQIPRAPPSLSDAAWYPLDKKNNRSRCSSKESSRQALQPQLQSQSRSSAGTARTRRSSKAPELTSQTSRTSSTCCILGRQPRHTEGEQRSGIMPSNIQPLRGDEERVLCKSRSRGYMVVRRILSLEALREAANMRTPGSLAGMMEELKHARQEMSGEWSRLMGTVNNG